MKIKLVYHSVHVLLPGMFKNQNSTRCALHTTDLQKTKTLLQCTCKLLIYEQKFSVIDKVPTDTHNKTSIFKNTPWTDFFVGLFSEASQQKLAVERWNPSKIHESENSSSSREMSSGEFRRGWRGGVTVREPRGYVGGGRGLQFQWYMPNNNWKVDGQPVSASKANNLLDNTL